MARRRVSAERKKAEQLYMVKREQLLRAGRKNFYNFCELTSPDFFKPRGDTWHLWLICNTLQALYERHLTKKYFRALLDTSIIPKWMAEDMVDWDRLEDGKAYKKLMLNVSPRMGKSRSIVNFCDWILGKSAENRIITVSYNNELASSMSRYVRDGIIKQKNIPTDIVYSDFFPETRIAKGNSGFQKWALEGSFFNYLGTGLEGSVTGVGTNCLIIDDPVKNAGEAFNEKVLDSIWETYRGTLLSRAEKKGRGSIEIIVMTRWATGDLCGRILKSPMGKDWIQLKIPVEHGGELSCPAILPEADYEELKQNISPEIFRANYYQEPMDMEGRLFKEFKLYDELPKSVDKIVAYCDTADEGDDYLALIIGAIHEGEGYITDIYFTKENMDVTEPETAKRLVDNHVNHAKIESNNGGRGFAKNVEKIVWEKYHTKQVAITWFHQTENKIARILTGSTFVQNHVYFPQNWQNKWPEFAEQVLSFSKEGRNKHDDGVEALIEWGKMITGDGSVNSYMEWMKAMKEGKV